MNDLDFDNMNNQFFDISSIDLSSANSTITITNPYSSGDYTFASISTNTTKQEALSVTGDAEFHGDLKIKGKSLSESLNNIERRLAILNPNTELESEWEKLKELGDQYRKLENEILEKQHIYNILRK